MTIYKIAENTASLIPELTDNMMSNDLFIICCSHDVQNLLRVFNWNADTIKECTNLDETVRHTDYNDHDFTSLIYMESADGSVIQQEINLFFSKKHLVLVLPDNMSERLERLSDGISKAVGYAATRPQPLAYLFCFVFDRVMADFSETLEMLEDEAEALAEQIMSNPHREQITEIGQLRKTAYTYKKLLRALSYIGGQILIVGNKHQDGDKMNYFSDISARLMRQYDFAENLYCLTRDLLHTYDSKFSARMNETVNKLTVITLFFAPLTFIAGVYGMNFVHMPELKWIFGYPVVVCVMAAVCIVLFIVIKKNKWL